MGVYCLNPIRYNSILFTHNNGILICKLGLIRILFVWRDCSVGGKVLDSRQNIALHAAQFSM